MKAFYSEMVSYTFYKYLHVLYLLNCYKAIGYDQDQVLYVSLETLILLYFDLSLTISQFHP